MPPLFGVDVSAHQAALDWGAAKADGIAFAIARASLGKIPDAEYKAKVGGARAAGLVTGAYHYLWPGVDTRDAVDVFLDQVGDPEGRLIALDVEHYGTATQPSAVMAAVREWVAEFRRRAGLHPLIVYTGGWFWDGRLGDPDGAWIGPLWHSRYVSASYTTPYRTLYAKVPQTWWTPGYGRWPRASFLQFTSMGKVDGYSGRLDVNAFAGTLEDLRRLTVTPALPDSSTAGDTMGPITAGGLTLASSHVIDAKAGVMLWDAPSDARVRLVNDAVLDYVGIPREGGYYAVVASTGTEFSDQRPRAVVLYVKSSDVPAPRPRTEAERRAAAERYWTAPAPAPDTTPYSDEELQARINEALLNAKANARIEIVWA